MKNDKILFWLNADLTHYTLSYYLQKKHQCELYAIIDITNAPKKFFQTQQLVTYKKIWFYHDNVKIKNDVDISFLENFEKEYGINLWQHVINERIFNSFNFHQFSRNELLSILEQSIKLYTRIIDEVKPDFFIAQWPILIHAQLIYEMILKRGIKCLILSVPKLAGKSLISERVHQLDYITTLNGNSKNRTLDELQKYIQNKRSDVVINQYWKSMKQSRIAQFNAFLKYILSKNDDLRTNYTYFGRSKFKVLFSMLVSYQKKRYRENFMEKHLRTKIDLSSPYVYFPMSVDMERNLLIDSPFFTNQIEIIRTVAKALPIGYRLYVKENPAQVGREWRPIYQYKEIMKLPNVFLYHPSVDGQELIKNSSLVISIAGASPFEAAFYRKPSIVFGNVIYSLLPSVLKVKELEKLPDLIHHALQLEINVSDLDKFVELLENNTISFDYSIFEMKYLHEFYYDGSLINSEIDPIKMEKFLNENKDDLEKLADAHINKIKQHKEQLLSK